MFFAKDETCNGLITLPSVDNLNRSNMTKTVATIIISTLLFKISSLLRVPLLVSSGTPKLPSVSCSKEGTWMWERKVCHVS